MPDTIQIAFQIPNADLERLDRYVPDSFPSRAAALRAAVAEWLDRQRQAEIDEALERGYDDMPEDAAFVKGLTHASEQALAEADLEW